MDASRYFDAMHNAMSTLHAGAQLLLTIRLQDTCGNDAYLEVKQLPVLVQAAEDDVDLCPLQGLPGVVNVRTVSDVAAALAAPKAPDLPPDYLALDPELPRWKERLGL